MTLILVLVSVSSILRLYRLVETQDSKYVGTTGDFGHQIR